MLCSSFSAALLFLASCGRAAFVTKSKDQSSLDVKLIPFDWKQHPNESKFIAFDTAIRVLKDDKKKRGAFGNILSDAKDSSLVQKLFDKMDRLYYINEMNILNLLPFDGAIASAAVIPIIKIIDQQLWTAKLLKGLENLDDAAIEMIKKQTFNKKNGRNLNRGFWNKFKKISKHYSRKVSILG